MIAMVSTTIATNVMTRVPTRIRDTVQPKMSLMSMGLLSWRLPRP